MIGATVTRCELCLCAAAAGGSASPEARGPAVAGTVEVLPALSPIDARRRALTLRHSGAHRQRQRPRAHPRRPWRRAPRRVPSIGASNPSVPPARARLWVALPPAGRPALPRSARRRPITPRRPPARLRATGARMRTGAQRGGAGPRCPARRRLQVQSITWRHGEEDGKQATTGRGQPNRAEQ